jgi:Na+-transporting NADH:ubiquinone oxidoreductase subunit A
MIRIKQGLRLPIAGEPVQTIEPGPRPTRVALVGEDYVGLKPALQVAEGDTVRRGQVLFRDRRYGDVCYTAPASGRVEAINRGERRAFQSLVIAPEGDEQESFRSFNEIELARLDRDTVRQNLLASGLWTALRTRPYSRVPDPATAPEALFITAIDTQPLAAQPEVVLADAGPQFLWGLHALRRLTDGPLYLCQSPGAAIPGRELDFVTVAEFDGPHPAGLPGTHIHFLRPASEKHTVWHVGYQDVIAVGRLFGTGQLSSERIVSLAGPSVKRPRLLRTQLGACVSQLVEGELSEGRHRVISGSVLSGRTATGVADFLGRFHVQVSALPEGDQREFLGWQKPGFDKFSVKRVFASAFAGGDRKLPLTTSLEGSRRAMVPIGSYEQVMPLDVIPTFLLRSLIVGDTEQARLLGCLELDEEDLSLCTFVCPGKYEYGPLLRRTLSEIEKG